MMAIHVLGLLGLLGFVFIMIIMIIMVIILVMVISHPSVSQAFTETSNTAVTPYHPSPAQHYAHQHCVYIDHVQDQPREPPRAVSNSKYNSSHWPDKKPKAAQIQYRHVRALMRHV